MDHLSVHRPRNVGWARAAALLYGDWGTSKAYVIGMAFLAMGYGSLPIILAVCALTGLVGYNYVIVCKHFPDGGGVYSSARLQSRLLAVVGSLLLVADLTVTASLSGWAAMAYFHVPQAYIPFATVGLIILVGLFNVYGPKHSGSMAVMLAVPTVVVVVTIICLSLPHLTFAYLQPTHQSFAKNWTSFVGVILALSGVEAIANLTGVMPLDKGTTAEKPCVVRTARKAIFWVALEVVAGTAILGWAMLSIPPDLKQNLLDHYDDMLTQLAIHYGQLSFGVHFAQVFGVATALIVGLLLMSAVNTAVVALIGLLYLLARDGEMPTAFAALNRHGVPKVPILIATAMPIVVIAFSSDLNSLAELYAIGVVGAITVNLSSCVLNKNLPMLWRERAFMAVTSVVLFAVEITLAKTKPNALFFIVCILIGGLGLRAFAQRKTAGALSPALAGEPGGAITPGPAAHRHFHPGASFSSGVHAILVAARGFTPVIRFALEEAQIRGATLYILYVRNVAVSLPVGEAVTDPVRWEDDPQAAEIMAGVFELVQDAGVRVEPVYVISNDPAQTILDCAEKLHIDILILGAPQRHSLAKLLAGNVVREVANQLPSRCQLLIHG